MYLRHTTVRRRGKVLVYWHLVRSVRHGRRVRQEVVATLGRLDARGRNKAQKLAEWITGKRCQPSLFEPADLADDATAEIEEDRTSKRMPLRPGSPCRRVGRVVVGQLCRAEARGARPMRLPGGSWSLPERGFSAGG